MAQPVFTQWDFLDPVSMGAKLASAHGSAVWDNQSLLSPARAEAQVNAVSSASPKPFNNFRGLYDSKWGPSSAAAPLATEDLAAAIGSI